jgi:hypothetical protein
MMVGIAVTYLDFYLGIGQIHYMPLLTEMIFLMVPFCHPSQIPGQDGTKNKAMSNSLPVFSSSLHTTTP